MALIYFITLSIFVCLNAHNSSLSPCPRGSYRATITLECELCPKGFYGSTSGLTSALCSAPCPVGKYNDKYGAQTPDDCQDCPAGHYGSTTGLISSQCTARCPAGTYSKLPGQISALSCLPCLAGYYMYQCSSERLYAEGVDIVLLGKTKDIRRS